MLLKKVAFYLWHDPSIMRVYLIRYAQKVHIFAGRSVAINKLHHDGSVFQPCLLNGII